MLPNSPPDSLTPTKSNLEARFFLELASPEDGEDGAANAEVAAAAPRKSSRNLMVGFLDWLFCGEALERKSAVNCVDNGREHEQDLGSLYILVPRVLFSLRRAQLRGRRCWFRTDFIWKAGEPIS